MPVLSYVSIITCTYNPNEKIFERVLKSIEHQVLDGIEIEYVIVDNNSNPPVIEMPIVRAFLSRNAWARLIVEKEQGLSYARIAGTKATLGDIIVFVDDDNELSSEYIKNTIQLFKDYPFVAVWGAGDVSVEFPESAPSWIEKEMKPFYLEKHRKRTEYATIIEMSCPAYPVGGGMAVKREIMHQYSFLVTSQNFKTTGRKAGSGASWDDTQINWLAIKKGYAVGVSPGLKFQHLISRKRATLKYILRLLYDGPASGLSAFYEIFPEELEHISVKNCPKSILPMSFLVILLGFLLRLKFNRAKMHIASHFGNIESYYRAFSIPKSSAYNLISSVFLSLIK